MTSLPCSILVTLDSMRFALINPGDVLEITRVQCDEQGNVTSLTLVPFVGPEIVVMFSIGIRHIKIQETQ